LTGIQAGSTVRGLKRISLFIAEPQYEAFQALAASQGRPYAELVRDALDQYLRERGTPPAAAKVRRQVRVKRQARRQ
jgi:hypothetical protein